MVHCMQTHSVSREMFNKMNLKFLQSQLSYLAVAFSMFLSDRL